MRHCNAIAASVANSTTFLLSTGRAPGIPRQTGHTFEFGGAPKRVAHEQKILLTVSNWTCTSRPMTGSYFVCAATELAVVVTIASDYKGHITRSPHLVILRNAKGPRNSPSVTWILRSAKTAALRMTRQN